CWPCTRPCSAAVGTMSTLGYVSVGILSAPTTTCGLAPKGARTRSRSRIYRRLITLVMDLVRLILRSAPGGSTTLKTISQWKSSSRCADLCCGIRTLRDAL
ncbi:MAG: hypothetical protein AVDCRST_MAG68-5707, partial [uncultured Gemmatimonadetes bacterium]